MIPTDYTFDAATLEFNPGDVVVCVDPLHRQWGNWGYVRAHDKIKNGRWVVDVLWMGQRYVHEEYWKVLARRISS